MAHVIYSGAFGVMKFIQQGRARFASEGGGPNEDRPDPLLDNGTCGGRLKFFSCSRFPFLALLEFPVFINGESGRTENRSGDKVFL